MADFSTKSDPLARFYRPVPAAGDSAQALGGKDGVEPAFVRGRTSRGYSQDSSDDELPVDDGRTPGRKAGWTDGLSDEQRNDLYFFDPKADDKDEEWVVHNLKHAAVRHAACRGAAKGGGGTQWCRRQISPSTPKRILIV